MHPNAELVTRFYDAFKDKDYRTMQACYHDEAEFQDEVFTLKGKEIGAMWHMLCERGADLSLHYHHVEADEQRGSARWRAGYTFSTTGRYVLNKLRAEFEFKDGKIYRHRDRFDFWRWSRHALGVTGWMLGWSHMLRDKVQATADRNLRRFIEGNPEYKE
ncbi:nuclear transport factor 2 family protein [Hahella sp. KA22]|uniref:nuclear transport factor 2 family protein n=1 Tax=Hahella sp. KA22 TaxID=1628392 RepID=UPI000FDDA7A7|nr:nuclear transport factor 2 family protein [Hahella sp. KA22]AZZ90722.1 nuclear transport factor 2 family protein [Hahella sp. KA22]QAY54092.1 nuclear transport factor 2 family protein [Hahella sp. KA22]